MSTSWKAIGAMFAGLLIVRAVSQSAIDESWHWALTTGPTLAIIVRWGFAASRKAKIGSRSIINSGIIGGALLSFAAASLRTDGDFEGAQATGSGAVSGLFFGGGVALIVFGLRTLPYLSRQFNGREANGAAVDKI